MGGNPDLDIAGDPVSAPACRLLLDDGVHRNVQVWVASHAHAHTHAHAAHAHAAHAHAAHAHLAHAHAEDILIIDGGLLQERSIVVVRVVRVQNMGGWRGGRSWRRRWGWGWWWRRRRSGGGGGGSSCGG